MAPPRRTSGERARYVSFIFPDLNRWLLFSHGFAPNQE
jgi:hypothetical protein